jgi:hypothetical protein
MATTATNYLTLSDGKVACEVFGNKFTFTKKEMEEIITLYDAVAGDWQGRKLCYRDEDGHIKLY